MALSEEQFQRLLNTVTQQARLITKKHHDESREEAASFLANSMRLTRGMANSFRRFMDDVERSSRSLKYFSNTVDESASAFRKITRGFAVSLVASSVMLTRWIANTTDTYRNLVDIGQNFGGSLFGMQRSAFEAGLTLREFSELLNQHAIVAAHMGQQSFTRLASDIRKTSEQFGMFGFSIEDLNNFTAQWLETQRLNSSLNRQTWTEQRVSVIELARTTSGFAALFGRSRREIMMTMQEAARQTAMLARGLNPATAMNERQRRAFEQINSFLSALPGEASGLATMLAQSLGAGGVHMSELFHTFNRAGMSHLNRYVSELAALAESGNITVEDIVNFNNQMREAIEQAAPTLRILQVYNQDAARVVQLGANLRRLEARNIREAMQQAEEQGAITRVALTLRNAWLRVFGSFMAGVIKPLEDMDRLGREYNLDGTVRWLSEQFERLGVEAGKFFSENFNRETISNFVRGMGEMLIQMGRFGDEMISQIRNLFGENFGQRVSEAFNSLTTVLTWMRENLPELKDKILDAVNSLGGFVEMIRQVTLALGVSGGLLGVLRLYQIVKTHQTAQAVIKAGGVIAQAGGNAARATTAVATEAAEAAARSRAAYAGNVFTRMVEAGSRAAQWASVGARGLAVIGGSASILGTIMNLNEGARMVREGRQQASEEQLRAARAIQSPRALARMLTQSVYGDKTLEALERGMLGNERKRPEAYQTTEAMLEELRRLNEEVRRLREQGQLQHKELREEQRKTREAVETAAGS